MRSLFVSGLVFFVFAIVLLANAGNAAQLTPGNVVVVRVGTADVSTKASFIDEYLPTTSNQGASVQTLALPTAASGDNAPLTIAGLQQTEGYIKASADGRYLTLAGYNAPPETTSPWATQSVGHTIGRIDLASSGPTIDTSTTLPGGGSGSSNNAIRSAVSVDGENFWAFSRQPGVRYAPLGSTGSFTTIIGQDNLQVGNIFDGQLYASGPFGIWKIGEGLPTTGGQTSERLPGMDQALNLFSLDFFFANSNTLYVASGFGDFRGGLQKWIFNNDSSIWELKYTLQHDVARARGVAGMVDESGNATLFYTTLDVDNVSKLISVTDVLSDTTLPSATFTTLASVAQSDGFIFHGVAIIPTAPPLLTGDHNEDGKVDAADFVAWRKSNIDGPQGYVDWRVNFGEPSGGGAQSAVPEPTSALLLLVALLGLGSRRRPLSTPRDTHAVCQAQQEMRTSKSI